MKIINTYICMRFRPGMGTSISELVKVHELENGIFVLEPSLGKMEMISVDIFNELKKNQLKK